MSKWQSNFLCKKPYNLLIRKIFQNIFFYIEIFFKLCLKGNDIIPVTHVKVAY